MRRSAESPAGLSISGQRCVEIRLWGIYFRCNRGNLQNTLSAYALEGGAVEKNLKDADHLTYRFLCFDWEKTIKSLLVNNSVPFEVVRVFEKDVMETAPLRKKVYLVEDDLDILFSLNVMLEDAGYDVLLSHCAKPLMEETLPPTDLFIVDKCMPDGDGLDIYRKLRSRVETRNTPVVIISALRSVQEQVVAAGVNDFLEKPFNMQELLAVVAKHTKARALN